MAIDFHSEKNRYTYASREADTGWAQAILEVTNPRGAASRTWGVAVVSTRMPGLTWVRQA